MWGGGAYPESCHRRFSDNNLGISQTRPDDFDEAAHVHVEDSRRIFCHLSQNQDSSIAPIALAFPS